MRILHVYSGNLYGGVESMLATLSRHRGRPAASHEFALCFDGRLSAELAAVGALVHRLGEVSIRKPHTAAAARRRLRALLDVERFDWVICHAPWSHALFGGVVRRIGHPLAFWAHDVAGGRHWTERLARRAVPELVICNSHFTRRSVHLLFPHAPTAVVYPPVEPPPEVDPEDGRRIRTSLDTSLSDVVIVQACRSEAWKGHGDLLDALIQLGKVPNWTWWQVGGAQRPAEAAFLTRLRNKAARAHLDDRIRWLGERSDVRRLLAAADVYCQPNRLPEPFGIAFVEALFAGLPVVTTGQGAAEEIVDPGCGVLVPPNDAGSLADALRMLIENPSRRAALSRGAPSRARALCSPVAQLDRLTEALTMAAIPVSA